jgi:divalent metal cation (Fe/Co/Zn/Cd) transporter
MLATRAAQLRQALRLGWFTVSWNVIECVVAVSAALLAGSRALLGFGFDSLVESLSASALIWRLRVERRDPDRAAVVEHQAVRLIGVTFFVLGAVVAFAAVRSLVTAAEPESSPVGIALTALSLAVMPVLAKRKRVLAVEMGSKAVEADSKQTTACVYLSAVVLAGLVLNAALGWWWADPVAALGVVALLVREGLDAVTAEHVDDCC